MDNALSLNQPLTATEPVTPAASISAANPVQPEALESAPTSSAAPGAWNTYEISRLLSEKRAQRYYLQSLARELLNRVPDVAFARKLWIADAEQKLGAQPPTTDRKARQRWRDEAQELLGPQPKGEVARGTCTCHRARISKDSGVQVLHIPGANKARYGNLQVCANVWLCAVCGGVISEARRMELTSGFEGSGLFKVLITYTLRHNIKDTCADMLDVLRRARKLMKGNGAYQRRLKELQLVGQVCNTEVLHNVKNGWHVHFHEAMVFERELTDRELAELEHRSRRVWSRSLQRCGRDATWKHGVTLTANESDWQSYLAKQDTLPTWTIDHELTKSAMKTRDGSADDVERGRTMYELLALYGAGDERAGQLWLEFARAFKGAHQLQWSRGLKERLGIVERSDEEIALDDREPASLLTELTADEWRVVLRLHLRSQLLDVAARGDADRLHAWLSEVAEENESAEHDKLPAADVGAVVKPSSRSDVDPAAMPAAGGVGDRRRCVRCT